MTQMKVKEEERTRRQELSVRTRKMLSENLEIVAEDETSIMTCSDGFFVQISFSEMHPLLVCYFVKELEWEGCSRMEELNRLNLRSVLGCHAVNEDVGCYTFRATIWLDTELRPERFREIFERYAEEAQRGFAGMTG